MAHLFSDWRVRSPGPNLFPDIATRGRVRVTGSDFEELQAALGDAYTIERELGRGGMATVYLARDAKHQRRVALKVLDPNLAASLGPERFRREVTTAAQLQHPHILGVHDSGETADGQLWFTMPYVEGESLRDRLRHERQMSVQDVTRIIREVAGALDYAHQKGVIHRDIKPENILLTTGGDALLADFGIARALDASATADGTSRGGLTQTGLSIGTPQYMSPEQAAGERTLDARSDIFSLGAVCYEMLAGEPPFSAPDAAGDRREDSHDQCAVGSRAAPRCISRDRCDSRARSQACAGRAVAVRGGDGARARGGGARDAPPPHRLRRRLPASEQRAPTRRKVPASALALILGLAIGGGALFAWRSHTQIAAPGESGLTRIAVLPFENVGDTSDAYFADGVTDAVRGKLTGVARHRGHRLGELRAVSQDDEDAAGDRPGARRALSAHRARALGARSGRHEPSAGEPGADRCEHRRGQVAAAVRRAAHRRVPGAGRHRVEGRAVARGGTDAGGEAGSRGEVRRRIWSPTTRICAGSPCSSSGNSAGSVAPRHRGAKGRRDQGLDLRTRVERPRWRSLAHVQQRRSLAVARRLGGQGNGDRAQAGARSARMRGRRARDTTRSWCRTTRARWRRRRRGWRAHRRAPCTRPRRTPRSSWKWDAAAADAMQAYTLDPRSPSVLGRLTNIAVFRRDTAARTCGRIGRSALAPANFVPVLYGVLADLQHGDLAAARRGRTRRRRCTDPSALVAYFGEYYDLGWMLDSAQDKLLLSLGVDSFDGD